jgi:hypothetical protein
MAKRSLLQQALARTRGVIQESGDPVSPDKGAGRDVPEVAEADGGATAQPVEFEAPALTELFAALRRGERPGDIDGRPPDTGRTDRLLAELDRAWRAPPRDARTGR